VAVSAKWCHIPLMSIFDDPEHWRDKAKAARSVAAQLKGADNKRTLLDIATQYDLLAERAERHKAAKAHGD
jgi:hypothetical protein